MFFFIHLGLEGITEVDTDPKGRFVSFKVTPSNESSLFVSLQGVAPDSSWLGRGGACCFEGLQNYNKNEGNENKIMVVYLNCAMDKIEWDSENKTKRLYRYCSNYALSKLSVDNGLKDL